MRDFRPLLLVILMTCIFFAPSAAEVLDKVVAFVDTDAITLSELNEAYEMMRELSPDISKSEVLNTMINRRLLLREARRLRLEAPDDDTLLDDYIDMKVRAFIKIKEQDMRDFYDTNSVEFKDKSYQDVKDDIESFLLEKEVNYQIRRHLDSLKEKAYIKILYESP